MLKLNDPGLFREASHVGGAWLPAEDGEPVFDPASGDRLGVAPSHGAAVCELAIEAASAAFPAWRATTAAARAEILHRLAQLMRANAPDLAAILTAEQGKPLVEARNEIAAGAAFFDWFAEEGRRANGEILPSPWPGRRLMVLREPVGVVGAITPWNFPSLMVARKLAPALAAGCSVVLKPAPETPFSALALADLAQRAGVPAGVFNCVCGPAAEIGGALMANSEVRKITFTGSTATGRLLMSQAAPGLKRLSMELGGNAPFIVFEDADLDLAVRAALAAKYRNAGQTCVCVNRFLVHAPIYDAFAERLAAASEDLVVGPGGIEGVHVGPLINAAAVAKVEAHVADAVGRGAQVMAGGGRHALGGTFFAPTVLAGVTRDMRPAREETFGPLAILMRFETEAEAIGVANDSEYGLAAYLCTQDLSRAMRVSEALDYGMVGVNTGLISSEVAPFGGVKASGFGREGSVHGLADYTSLKYVCIEGL